MDVLRQVFSHTREYGKRGDLNKDFFTVQLKVAISDDTESKGATINFYKNGKIRFSGGFIGSNISNQPELIRRFIVNNYSDKEAFLYTPFEYNNLSGQFRVNGIFKSMDTLTRKFVTSYGATDVKYEAELSPFMYLTYKGHKYILAKSGNIQISGASNTRGYARVIYRWFSTGKNALRKWGNLPNCICTK